MSLLNNSSLLHVKVDGTIYDSIANINVQQVFKSTNTNPLEVIYKFALDKSAIITKVSLQIGDRHLIGMLNDKKTNIQNYEKAIENKHTALTLEKYNDSYKLQLGNIEPNQELIVKFSYITILKIINNSYIFALPTNIAPKYIQNIKSTENITNITSSIIYSNNPEYDFNINIIIKSVNTVEHIDCNNQDTQINNISPNEFLITSTTLPKNGDFIIKYDTIIKPCAYRFEDYCYLNFNFPSEEIIEETPKIYNIIIDRSGSMNYYNKIDNAKEALRLFVLSLPNNCYFNIISFGSDYSAYGKYPIKYSDDNIKFALTHINKMSANMGGTELYKCLECCIKGDFDNYNHNQWLSDKPNFDEYENIIIVLTDGQVSYDINNIFDKYKDNYFRVFTLGIGKDCNRHQLESIAENGRGICRMENESKKISDGVIDILDISNKKHYDNIKYNDEIIIKSAYPNMFIPVFIKLIDSDDNNILELKYSDKNYNINMINVESGKFIKQLYYNQIINNKKNNYNTIIDISKKYSILSEYTSFFLYDYNKISIDDEMLTENIIHYNENNNMGSLIGDNLEDQSRILENSNYIGIHVMENLSQQGERINRFEKKSVKLGRKGGYTKKWCSKEITEPSIFTKICTSIGSSFKKLFGKEEDIKETNRQRKAKTDELRQRYGLLEDDDIENDDIENNDENKDKKIELINLIDLINFRTSDGSFRLCDELIILCDFKDSTEFYNLSVSSDIIPHILINIIVLLKLKKINENKYKLIIKYLEEWLNKQEAYIKNKETINIDNFYQFFCNN